MILKELDFDSFVQDDNSFDKLKKIGFPNHKNEDYRHINLKDILERDLLIETNSSHKLYDKFKSDEFYSLVFIDGKPNLEISNLCFDISFTYSTKEKGDKTNSLSLLNESFTKENNILTINKNLDKPLRIMNISSGTNKFLVHNLSIKVGDNIVADILEIFISSEDSANVHCINREFFLKNANLNYIKLNASSKQDILNINNFIYINKGDLSINTMEKGSKQSINNYDVFLNDELSNIDMYGVIKISDQQNIANTIKINHNAKNSSSNQVFKHILDEHSVAVFNSQITINKNCSYSKAHQNSQSILLNDDARIFNEPRMMIFTDELEASHGATVGSLNDEAINYMKLRGLPQEICEKMLISAFLTEIYDHVKNNVIKEHIKDYISKYI